MSSMPPERDVLPAALVEAWRADTASSGELRRGYARFIRQRQQRVALPRVARFALGGLVLGLGMAQAASLVSSRWGKIESGSSGKSPAAAGTNAAPRQSPRVPAAPSARASATLGDTDPIAPPPATPSEPESERQPGAPRGPTAVGARSTAPQSEVEAHWQRAAAALRDKDFERAQAALLQVERHGGRAEGEAARLARAQLHASHGQTALASELARTLAGQAESAVVRAKARALLEQLSENGSTHRSTEPDAAAKGP